MGGPRRGRAAATGLALALLVLAGCAGTDVGPDASDRSSPPASTRPAPTGSSPTMAEPVGQRAPAGEVGDAKALVAGLNHVGMDLFAVAAAGPDDDVVLSPLSIGLAFGMADVGATGATADALADLFDYPVDGEARWAAFNTLEQAVTDRRATTVTVANREFPDVSFAPEETYQERLGRWFGTAIEPLPLRDQPDASREHINGFVADRTNDLIPELLPQGFINPNSVMVLVNALYLKADWAVPFGKYATDDGTFTRLDDTQVSVPLMRDLENPGPAVATSTYAATEIGYADDDLSMLVIVPEPGQFEAVQDRFSDDLVDEVDRTATSQAVELWLPRFTSDTSIDLEESFDALGVTDVFGAGGQWDGIAEGIVLESGVHAADISVDEIGTEAAAATALGFSESGPPEPDVVVRADRPFLYLVRHLPTGAVLFAGRVMDPSA